MKLSDEIRAMTGVPTAVADAVAALEDRNARLTAALSTLRNQCIIWNYRLYLDDADIELVEEIVRDVFDGPEVTP